MSDMPERIWLHKQSEVVLSRKPESLTSALFESYVRADKHAGLERQRDELVAQITEAREFLTECASHNPQIERVLELARQKLRPIAKAEKDDE